MRPSCFAACAVTALGLAACDVSVEGGLTGNLVETVRADLPPKTPQVTALASATACRPDTAISNPDLVLEAPRINLTFCEFEEPLAADRFELRGLNAGQRYQVSTFNLAPLADTLIDIYDESGRSIAFNDDRDEFDRSSTVSFEATATMAIVEVRSRDQSVGPSQGYSLLATADVPEPSPPCSPDASEDNDIEAAARSLGPATTDDGLDLNFCEDAIDYFLLDVVPGESRQVNTFGLGLNADTVLELFAGPSEAAGVIAFSDDAQGRERASTVSFAVPQGVTSVLLKLTSFAGAIGDDHEYSLTTQIPPDQALQPDSFEENDIDAQAAELGTDGPAEGIALNFVDDPVDYFLLPVDDGTAYSASTSDLQAQVDTVLEVFGGPTEASGLIGANDDTDTNGDGSTDSKASNLEFIVPAGVSSVLIKVRQFIPATTGNGTGYRLAAARVPPDLSISTGSSVFLPKGGELVQPRTFLGFSRVFNQSPNTVRGQVAYILSSDPIIDPSDLRIPGNQVPPFNLAPFSSVTDFRNIGLPATSNGIFYLGASIESDSFVGETFESTNQQVILSPLRLTEGDADNCIDDIADTEFLVGSSGPGSGGDDRAPSSPFLNYVNEAQTTFLYSHCVDTEDWSRIFSPAGQTVLVSTVGLGTAGDTVVGLYRDRGNALIMEGDDLVAGAGQARNSFLRFTHEQDEVLFVRATSRTGGGPNRGYFLNVVGERTGAPLPDLVASIAAAPEAAALGEIFQVTVEVRNLGGGAAPESTAQVGLACVADLSVTQQETVLLLSEIRVPGLGPQSVSQPFPRQISIDPALLPAGFTGACKLFAVADSNGAVVESVDDFGQPGIELPGLGRFLNSSGDRAFSIATAPGFALSRSPARKRSPAVDPVTRSPPETGSTTR